MPQQRSSRAASPARTISRHPAKTSWKMSGRKDSVPNPSRNEPAGTSQDVGFVLRCAPPPARVVSREMGPGRGGSDLMRMDNAEIYIGDVVQP
eukprot:5688789-Prymnesium_polylepis.1